MSEDTPIRPTQRWPAGTAETLMRLWNLGLGTMELARRFAVTTRAIDSKVRRLRVEGHELAARRPRHARPSDVLAAPGRPGDVLAAPGRPGDHAPRCCLYCGALFASSHIGNRICPTCLDEGPFSGAIA